MSERRIAMDNYTIGQIGGRLLNEHLRREARKYMQRYTEKVRLTDVTEQTFVSGFAGQRLYAIADELAELWPNATPEQCMTFLERLSALARPE